MPSAQPNKTTPPARPVMAPWLKLVLAIAAVFGALILVGILYVVGRLATTQLRALSEATTKDVPQLQTWLSEQSKNTGRYPTDQQYQEHYLPSRPYTNADAVNSATGEAYLYKQVADGCSYTIQLINSPLGEGYDVLRTWTAPINLCAK